MRRAKPVFRLGRTRYRSWQTFFKKGAAQAVSLVHLVHAVHPVHSVKPAALTALLG